eukprot:PITA_09371
MVHTAWRAFIPPPSSKMFQFEQHLKDLKAHIKIWNHSTFGNIFQQQRLLEQEVVELQLHIIQEGRNEASNLKEQNILNQLEERRYSTQEILEHHQAIEAELVSHLKSVVQEDQLDRRPTINKILHHISKLIMEEHNQLLLCPTTLMEVEQAILQNKECKAPGPDDFTSNFFHHFWDLIKDEIWQLVEESRSMHWILPSLNSTFITLIPKEDQAAKPDKFFPIALCNAIYKIISKVIANRLKPLLPLLISPEQTSYVEGRQILDGIILTHEIMQSLKQTKKLGMLLKIDLSKYFDKLNWNFIQQMLAAFGFSSPSIIWVISLISSSFFSILVNGIPSHPFSPSRGIRQGDPLSPFLFVLMAEGLGCLIIHALHSRQLRGISVHEPLAHTHQQFVDDTMLFGHPSTQEASAFKSLLDLFFEALGITVNASKSQIFFFNTPLLIQHHIARICGFSIARLPAKYLGAPFIVSALKHSSWRSLLDKLEDKLSSWIFFPLNLPSRLILVKSILQTMPLYLFSVLAAPKWVLK